MKLCSPFIFLTFLFFSLDLCSQNFIAEYHYHYQKNNSPVAFSKNAFLSVNSQYSLFEIKNDDYKGYTTEKLIDPKSGEEVVVFKSNKSRFVYKDLRSKTLINKEKILLDEFATLDSLNIFKWELLADEQSTILGFICKKAKLRYRGRNYIAYYCPDIPCQNGPFKFHGLPGLIMEIQTTDEDLNFFIRIKRFDISTKNLTIENPYVNEKKIYNWDEYTDMYRMKYNEYNSYSNGNDNKSIGLPKGKIEIIIND